MLTRHRDTLIDVYFAFRAGVPRLAGARPAVHVIVTRAVVTRARRTLVDVHLTMSSFSTEGCAWVIIRNYHRLLNNIGASTRNGKIKHAPVQPATQLHSYPLTSSSHVAPFWHGFDAHSSMSVRQSVSVANTQMSFNSIQIRAGENDSSFH